MTKKDEVTITFVRKDAADKLRKIVEQADKTMEKDAICRICRKPLHNRGHTKKEWEKCREGYFRLF